MRFAYPASALVLLAFGCSDPSPNEVLIELAPEVVSSIDGTLHVRAMAIGDRTPLAGEQMRLTVAYTDRNGTDHAITGAEGKTDDRGAFEAAVAGLEWEGTGTVTAAVVDGAGAPVMAGGLAVEGAATFAVLDRTPPTVEILPPTTDNHVGPGLPLEIQIHVTDEIGTSQVIFEAAGELETTRSSVIASGSTDSTVTFRVRIPDGALAGPTITLYALATDLSGNQAAAAPVVLTVDPAVAIATPPGLTGTSVATGTDTFLTDPRAIAVGPRDGKLYVADGANNAPCNGACIRVLDPTTGALDPVAVVVGQGSIEGIAFDATGDNLYYSDNPDRLQRMTWNPLSMRYETSTTCNVIANQNPRGPFHLIVDASLGVLVADRERQRVSRQAACNQQNPVAFSTGGNLDFPYGIASDPTGRIFVSDFNRDEVSLVDRTSGAVTRFEDARLASPRGLDWLAGGGAAFGDSLMVTSRDDRTVYSTRGGSTSRAAVYLSRPPVDVAATGTTLYVITEAANGARGRVFKVTGF